MCKISRYIGYNYDGFIRENLLFYLNRERFIGILKQLHLLESDINIHDTSYVV